MSDWTNIYVPHKEQAVTELDRLCTEIAEEFTGTSRYSATPMGHYTLQLFRLLRSKLAPAFESLREDAERWRQLTLDNAAKSRDAKDARLEQLRDLLSAPMDCAEEGEIETAIILTLEERDEVRRLLEIPDIP